MKVTLHSSAVRAGVVVEDKRGPVEIRAVAAGTAVAARGVGACV